MKSVRGRGSEAIRKCLNCGAALNQYHVGTLCFPCQKKESERLAIGDSPTYDVNDMARILRLQGEQVRRLARKGKLPPRVPAGRKWLWSRDVVDQWIRSEGRLPEGAAGQLSVLGDAHGGWHVDEATGQMKVGRPETVTPVVSDRSGSKIEVYTEFSPGHSEFP